MKRRVVITGLGIISPIGIGKDVFWRNLLAGHSGALSLRNITCSSLFGDQIFRTSVVSEVPDFAPLDTKIASLDRFIQFALLTAKEAINDAHLTFATRREAGITLATAICGTQTLDEEFVKLTHEGKDALRSLGASSTLYQGAMGNSATVQIACHFGFHGECLTLSTGCIGGIDAISYAYESISNGEHNLMLAGASEAPISPITISAFEIINCLSTNPDPESASRPFTQNRDGFVLAEGCGMVVLEELEHALQRGATIYAEISGCAVTEHAVHMTDMSENGVDLARAILDALAWADVRADQIDFVNAHGTSTPQNDFRETIALKTALGEHARSIPINSTKSLLGHSLAASSAMEIVACTLSLRDQKIHPTIHYEDQDPRCDLDYVPHLARNHEMEYLLTTASGFSGLHAAMVMRRWQGRGSDER